MKGGQERNRLHGATRNGACLRAIPHHLSVKELSQEELQDNICLRYGLMPQDISTTCDSCGKQLSIKYTRSCLKSDLVLACHDNTEK